MKGGGDEHEGEGGDEEGGRYKGGGYEEGRCYGGTAETKVSNTGGNFFLLFIQIHSPCTMYLPHFLFIILRMKG